MIIITTGELSCCGGGWLSRGCRFWWQISKVDIIYLYLKKKNPCSTALLTKDKP